MLTTIIVIIALFLLLILIRVIINEDDDDIRTLQMVSAVIIIMMAAFLIFGVNSMKYTSKTKVTPTVEINITKLDSLVTRSDTTYIYTFRE